MIGNRLIKATHNSMDGIKAIWGREPAFRQEIYFSIVTLPFVLYSTLPGLLKALMICGLLLMITIEVINSAIESIVDRLSPGFHPEAKYVKDLGSAAVGITIIINGIIWGYAGCVLSGLTQSLL